MWYGQVGKIFFSSRQLGPSLAALSAAKRGARIARAIFSFPGRREGEGGRERWTFVPLLCALWAGSPEVVVGHDKWAEMAMKDYVWPVSALQMKAECASTGSAGQTGG